MVLDVWRFPYVDSLAPFGRSLPCGRKAWPFADRNARNGASKGPKHQPALVRLRQARVVLGAFRKGGFELCEPEMLLGAREHFGARCRDERPPEYWPV